MPVVLFTGTPGAGKTLGALEHCINLMGVNARQSPDTLVESIKAQCKINLVVVGVEGIREDVFQVDDDPYNWQEYPDGTVFLVDEAWKWFGSHNQEVKKDPRVLSLAEHRHRGMSFILTSQYPMQLIPHVRALVDEHIHVRRKFGTGYTVRFRWPHLVENPNQIGPMKDSEENGWTFPEPVYQLYKSATVHTIKRRIPRKVWFLIAALIGTVGLGIWAAVSIFGLIDRWTGDEVAEIAPDPAQGAGSERGPFSSSREPPAQDSKVVTPVDWLLAHVPRVQGIPVSAPIYDDLRPVTYPRLACAVIGEWETSRDCRCFTQQHSRVTISLDLCRSIVESGWFDPFLETLQADISAPVEVPEVRELPANGVPGFEVLPPARLVEPGKKPTLGRPVRGWRTQEDG